ncbi:MAG TPA: helix-turn-helix transcriptional regulator [Bacteroidales bacterium]|nr:helix-turn-helix transcriptional regulator [Bacteroidales bacterium]
MDIKAAFGTVLRKYRTKVGLSQEHLALEAGLDRSYISLIERGLRGASLETIITLAHTLDITAAILVQETEQLISLE